MARGNLQDSGVDPIVTRAQRERERDRTPLPFAFEATRFVPPVLSRVSGSRITHWHVPDHLRMPAKKEGSRDDDESS